MLDVPKLAVSASRGNVSGMQILGLYPRLTEAKPQAGPSTLRFERPSRRFQAENHGSDTGPERNVKTCGETSAPGWAAVGAQYLIAPSCPSDLGESFPRRG